MPYPFFRLSLIFFFSLFLFFIPIETTHATHGFPDGTPACHGDPFRLNFKGNRMLEPGESITCKSEQSNQSCKPCCDKDASGNKSSCLVKNYSCTFGAGNNACSFAEQDCICKPFNVSCVYKYKDEPEKPLTISEKNVSPSNDSTYYPDLSVIVPPPPDDEPPVPACNTTCSVPGDCAAAKDGCVYCPSGGGTCQKPPSTPACNTLCSTPADCTGAKDGCTACIGGSCKKPETPQPACNTACSAPFDCLGAKDGCTSCTGGKCQKPPTPEPACNTACTTPADCVGAKDSCTSCIGGKCQKPPSGVCKPKETVCACSGADAASCDTCNGGWCKGGKCETCSVDDDEEPEPEEPTATPTVTPTPDFSPDMCKCDGIEATNLISGQTATFTAFSKVEGADVSKATVTGVRFRFTEDTTLLAQTGFMPPTQIVNTATLKRFQTNWTQKIPSNPKSGAQYRVFADIRCSAQTTGGYLQQPKTIASADGSIMNRIIGFFTRLVGRESATEETKTIAKNSPSQQVLQGSTGPTGDPLQIGTFNPAHTVTKTCNFVKFKFGE